MDHITVWTRAGVLSAAIVGLGIVLAHPNDAHAVGCGAGSLALSNVQITSLDGSAVAAIDATCSAGPFAGNDVGAGGTLLTNLNTNNIFAGYTEDLWEIFGATSFTPTPGDPDKGGTFTVDFSPEQFSVFALALKGATNYGVYLFDLSPILAELVGGEYKMTGILVPGPSGNLADLSHITSAVYVPLPASLPLLFAGLAGLAFVSRRRRRAIEI